MSQNIPTGQTTHALELDVFANVPGRQSGQLMLAEPSDPEPAAHAVQLAPVVAVYCPGEHCTQVDEPATDCVPPEHVVHTALVVPENVPAWHRVHWVEPLVANDPASHCTGILTGSGH